MPHQDSLINQLGMCCNELFSQKKSFQAMQVQLRPVLLSWISSRKTKIHPQCRFDKVRFFRSFTITSYEKKLDFRTIHYFFLCTAKQSGRRFLFTLLVVRSRRYYIRTNCFSIWYLLGLGWQSFNMSWFHAFLSLTLWKNAPLVCTFFHLGVYF